MVFSASGNCSDVLKTNMATLVLCILTFHELFHQSDKLLFKIMQDKAISISHLLPTSKTHRFKKNWSFNRVTVLYKKNV